MRYHLRLMHQEDAIQMAEISLQAFPAQQPPTNYQREFRNPLAHYVVAFDSPSQNQESYPTPYMVGYAGFWLMAGEAHIVDIAVRPAYQRQGIGELLVISLLDLALVLNMSQATLEVRASNQAAINLYTKYGFETNGVRRRYYLDNKEDAVIMTIPEVNSQEFLQYYEQLKKTHAERWGFKLYPLVR